MDSENQSTDHSYSNADPELIITNQMRHYLLEAAKWGRFLGILGFIFIGLMVIGAFTFGSVMTSMMNSLASDAPGYMSGGMGIIMTIYFLVFALLYFFPTLYLYQFSTKIKSALLNNQALDLAFAFSRLKSFFKFWGILFIIILALYALGIVGFLVGSSFMGR